MAGIARKFEGRPEEFARRERCAALFFPPMAIDPEMKDARPARVSAAVRALTLIALAALLTPFLAAAEGAQGLLLRMTAGAESDTRVARTVALHVPAGQPVSPFLPAGRFTARFEGTLTLEKRSRLVFTLEGTGTARILIDDEVLVEGIGKPNESKRLSSGEHRFVCEYESPVEGAADLRLSWEERDFSREPVPASVFSHDATEAGLVAGQRRRAGRALVAAKRCTECHAAGAVAMPETQLAAPVLTGVGERLRADWLVKWIVNPKSLRPTSHMPVVFGENAEQNAADLVAFLTADVGEESAPAATPEQIKEGGHLFHQQGCIACHTLKGSGDGERIGLEPVGRKFRLGALVEFLQEPARFHPATRMPTYGFSDEEAVKLAGFLRSLSNDPGALIPAGDATKGKELFGRAGCADCHQASDLATTRPAGPALGALKSATCTSVDYALTEEEQDVMQAFLGGADAVVSLGRKVPAEFAHRQYAALRCDACHDRDGRTSLREKHAAEAAHLEPPAPPVDEGHPALKAQIPPLDHLGYKLRPGWREELFAGKITPKMRPWMEARMPAFPSRAKGLAEGFSHAVGLAAVPEELAPIDDGMVEVGKAMTGVAGGLSCGTCHAIGKQPPIAVFEGQGPNLARAPRLRRGFFHRWMTDPPRVWPGTIMPKYADEDGKTPLTQHYDGDAEKQFEAIFHYLRSIKNEQPSP